MTERAAGRRGELHWPGVAKGFGVGVFFCETAFMVGFWKLWPGDEHGQEDVGEWLSLRGGGCCGMGRWVWVGLCWLGVRDGPRPGKMPAAGRRSTSLSMRMWNCSMGRC